MTFGKAFNFTILAIISLILIIILFYQFVLSENGEYYYRDEYGDLLRWTRPLKDCFIENEEGTESTVTPILGTDQQGRDLAYRISKALFTDLWLSVLGAGIIFVILGTSFGILIGYDQPAKIGYPVKLRNFKKFISIRKFSPYGFLQVLANLTVQTFHSIPLLLLLLIVVIVVEKTVSNSLGRMFIVLLSVGFFSTPKLALLIKDRIQLLEEEEFIQAAKAAGLSDWKIVWTHIIRYESSSIIISQGVYVMIQAIMFETVISFLGYGVRGFKYESIGKLIFEFQNTFPGAIGGETFALMPVFVLVLVAIVGSGWERIVLSLRYE